MLAVSGSPEDHSPTAKNGGSPTGEPCCYQWKVTVSWMRAETMQSLTKANCTLLGDLEDFYAGQYLPPLEVVGLKKLFNNISITKTPSRLQPTENKTVLVGWFKSLVSIHLTEIHWNIPKPEGKKRKAEKNPGHHLLRILLNFFK